jgi:hypothetical protein
MLTIPNEMVPVQIARGERGAIVTVMISHSMKTDQPIRERLI